MAKRICDTFVRITLDELKQRWDQCLNASETAVRCSPQTYAQIRKLAVYVLTHPVDIDEYAGIAHQLSRLIEDMGRDTLFYCYFHDHIDPLKLGRAQYFRPMCQDLLDRLNWFARWRAGRRRLRVVSSS